MNSPTSLADAVWAAARRLSQFSATQLAQECGVSLSSVQRHLKRWVDEGAVERSGHAAGARFVVTGREALAAVPPREQSPERNMWTVMRNIGAFTIKDVVVNAATDTLAISDADGARFVRALLRAGYLRVMRTAVPSKRPAVYRLIRNTGPQPPRECRVTAVWDPNLGAFTHLPEVRT